MMNVATMSYQAMHRRLIELLIQFSFQFSEEPRFKLASGGRSHFYINCKRVTLSPEGQWLIGHMVFEKVKNLTIQGIGGLTLGADAIATAAAYTSWMMRRPIESFIVRKEMKDHGIIAPIEGKVTAGDLVVAVDDVITTGGSTIKAIRGCRDNGLQVVAAITLVDRQEMNGRENILAEVPQVDALVTKDELMEMYRKIQ